MARMVLPLGMPLLATAILCIVPELWQTLFVVLASLAVMGWAVLA